MAGRKHTSELTKPSHNAAVSDYPDLVSDTTVTLAVAKIVPDVAPEVLESVKFSGRRQWTQTCSTQTFAESQ